MEAPESMMWSHRLPNGLTVLGQTMSDVASASCSFYVRTGARDEEAAMSGVSHFLEHMVFKGTATRSGPQIDVAFEELGADHNAATSVEYTYYWARVLGENLAPAIELLADMMRPRLDAHDLDAERQVILEEIARSEDVPDRVLMRALLEGFFAGHPLANSVLGSRESIRALTAEAMRTYWQERYGAANVVFAVGGNCDPQAVTAQVEALCGHWPAGAAGRVRPPAAPRAGFQVLTRESMQHQTLCAALPLLPAGDADRYAADVLTTILGGRSGSRLYWGVREQGLAQVAVASGSAFEGAGLLLVYLSADPSSMQAAWQTTQRELARLQEGGVSEGELARAKTKLASRTVMDGESSTQRMLALLDSWIALGRLETLDEAVESVEAVTAADCRRVLDRVPLTAQPLVVTLGPLVEGAL